MHHESLYEHVSFDFPGFVIQVYYLHATNFALAHNKIPLVHYVEVTIDASTPALLAVLKDKNTINISAKYNGNDLFAPLTAPIPRLEKLTSKTLVNDVSAQTRINPTLLQYHDESTFGDLTISVTVGGQTRTKTAKLRILAPNEWFNAPAYYQSLAAFVQPNSEVIEPLKRDTAEILGAATGSTALNGYQAGSERALEIAAAAFQALQDRNLIYSEPPASFEHTGQRVRTSTQVLHNRNGTCIDLAITYAALLEQVGLHPVIVIIHGHALAGLLASKKPLAHPVIYNSVTIRNYIQSGELVPIETVLMTTPNATFRDAVMEATNTLQRHPGLGLVSVHDARLDGMRPLPNPTAGTGEFPAYPATGTMRKIPSSLSDEFALPTDLQSDNMNVSAIRIAGSMTSTFPRTLANMESHNPPTGTMPTSTGRRQARPQNVPARIATWQRELLDLSLRNRLLNMRASQEVLPLQLRPGMLAELDDIIHQGQPLTVFAHNDVTENRRLQGIRSVKELSADYLLTALTDMSRVYADITQQQYKNYFNNLRRTVRTLKEETGSANLYLTLGGLVYERNDRVVEAPLFLIPITLLTTRGNDHVHIKVDSTHEASPNYCLVEWLKQAHNLDIPALSTPRFDESGLDISYTVAEISRQLLAANLPFTVTETANIIIAKFSTYGMWKDIHSHWAEFLSSPIFRHIALQSGESFIEPAPLDNSDIRDIDVSEETLALPIPADGAQLKAIVAAGQGRSFVLEGPPGTGKSQTITNMIAHCLDLGKTVLFVAEKQAALDVVKTRLNSVGLGPFVLDLHGEDQNPTSIRHQLKSTIDAEIEYDLQSFAALQANLKARLQPFLEYPEAIHAKNALDHSLWSATSLLCNLSDVIAAPVPVSFVKNPTDSLEYIEDVVYNAAAYAQGLDAKHVALWQLLGPSASLTTDEAFTDAWEQVTEAYTILRKHRDIISSVIDLPILEVEEAVTAIGSIPKRDHIPPTLRESAAKAEPHIAAVEMEAQQLLNQAEGLLEIFSPAFLSNGDIDALLAEANAVNKGFLGRKKRLAGFAAAVKAASPDPHNAVIDVTGEHAPEQLIPVLRSIPLLRTSAEELKAKLKESEWTDGLSTLSPFMPELVNQLNMRKQQIQFQLAAAQRWPELIDADEAELKELPHYISVIGDAWTAWLDCLGTTPEQEKSFMYLYNSNHLDVLLLEYPRWQASLKAGGFAALRTIARFNAYAQVLKDAGFDDLVEQLLRHKIGLSDVNTALLRGVAEASIKERIETFQLDGFRPDIKADQLAKLQSAMQRIHDEARLALPARLLQRRPYKPGRITGSVAKLRRLLDAKRSARSFRSLLQEFPREITTVAPCFMVNPASLATFVAPGSVHFDVVIFDEASQITVDQAMGALGRGTSAVIVGDSKQMPPTRIGKIILDSPNDNELGGDDDMADVEDLESILTEAVESGLPQLWLTWHYRSQDESLIAFSNERYYEGKLASLPSPGGHIAAGVSLKRVDGQFNRQPGRLHRTNEVEAHAIVAEISERLNNPITAQESLGVVTFNTQQRNLILDLLEASEDPLIHQKLHQETDALFVKNLENVQGDERDTILFSVAFSKQPSGGPLPLNFGPITRTGGEKRLNVAITRARRSVVMFASFDAVDIDLSRTKSQGMADLRGYMLAATAVDSLTTTLTTAGKPAGAPANDDAHGEQLALPQVTQKTINQNHVRDDVAQRLRDRGWVVETDYGMSSFTLDLVIRPQDDERWHVGVLLDGPKWYHLPTVSDRDLVPELLKPIMQWASVTRVWLPEWAINPDGVVDKLENELAAAQKELAARDARFQHQLEEIKDRLDQQRDAATEQLSEEAKSELAVELLELEAPAIPPAVTSGTASQTGAKGISKITGYSPVELRDLGTREDFQRRFSAARRAELGGIIEDAVNANGPISLNDLRILIAKAFGYAKGSQKINDRIKGFIPKDLRHKEGRSNTEFVWPRGVVPHEWRGVRASNGQRTASQISLWEVRNAMAQLDFIDSVPADSSDEALDDVIRETMKVFGLKRKTTTVTAHFTEAFKLLKSHKPAEQKLSVLVQNSVKPAVMLDVRHSTVGDITSQYAPGMYAVVDVETTGFSSTARIVEMGIVVLDDNGEALYEWSTLINPMRDFSNGTVHGITAKDVAVAPTFDQIADDVAMLLEGKIFVAHNAAFNARMLKSEFDRVGLAMAGLMDGHIDTSKLMQDAFPNTIRSLEAGLSLLGIHKRQAHNALLDARATGRLFAKFLADELPEGARPTVFVGDAMHASREIHPLGTETMERDDSYANDDWLSTAIDKMPSSGNVDTDSYLQLLDFAMLDFELSPNERRELTAHARNLGMSQADTDRVHMQYIRQLVRVVMSDGGVTQQERDGLWLAADTLGISREVVEEILNNNPTIDDNMVVSTLTLQPGDRVAFTGTHSGEEAAKFAGLIVGDVTEATVMVVAADPDSTSAKAKKARQYHIPIITKKRFNQLVADLMRTE